MRYVDLGVGLSCLVVDLVGFVVCCDWDYQFVLFFVFDHCGHSFVQQCMVGG